MPVLIPADHYAVAYYHTQVGSGQKAVVTLGIRDNSASFAVARDQVDTAYRLDVMPLVTSDWVHDKSTWASQDGVISENFFTTPGGDGSAATVGCIAHLIHKRTGLPGRRQRGRMFIPGVPEGVVDGTGTLTAGRQTDWTGALNAWREDIIDQDCEPVLLHNFFTLEPPEDGSAAPTVITQFAVSAKVGVQRRRLRGG